MISLKAWTTNHRLTSSFLISKRLSTKSHIIACSWMPSITVCVATSWNGQQIFWETANRKSSLKVRAAWESPVTSGVPQGSVLGPLLFLIFINDLPDHATSSTTRLFADDSVLYKRITTPEDSKLLQDDLDALVDWETKWSMRFNASKCQLLRITNKRKPILASYSIHEHELELVDAAKYLGVHIDSKLSFNTHVDAVTKKANSTRAFLSRNLSHCSRKIKETSYKTFVRPIAEYAASAWDPHTQRNVKKIEQIQRSSARFVTGNYDRTCSVTAMVQKSPVVYSSRQASHKQTGDDVPHPVRPDWHQLAPVSHPINIEDERPCITFPVPTVQLIHLLQLLLPSHHPWLECPGKWSSNICVPRRLQDSAEGPLNYITPGRHFYSHLVYICTSNLFFGKALHHACTPTQCDLSSCIWWSAL